MKQNLGCLAAIIVATLLVAFLGSTLLKPWSEGRRDGVLQRFSKKGFFVKSWEGELALIGSKGRESNIVDFSIENDNVADQLNALEIGTVVRVHYTEYKVYNWFRYGSGCRVYMVEVK